MRSQVRALVEGVCPVDESEEMDRSEVLSWIDSGAAYCRTKKPATPPKHLVSYSVLLDVEAGRVLLVDHRDAGLWLPAGGHVEPGEDPANAASRELSEELGIEPRFVVEVGPRPLMVTVTQTGGVSAGHVDVSLWYVFAGAVGQPLVIDEREMLGTRWWPLERVVHAEGTRFDPNLPRFLAKLEAVFA